MTESNSEKRSFPRVAISLKIQIQKSDSRMDAELVDLTVQGISFKIDRLLSAGSRITIFISDSEDIRINELEGEVLRCDSPANVNPPQYYPYYVAAKFVEVNDEFLMDSLALVHGKKNQP